ncbi:MAG: response regulator [Oscillatoriophycideae cyanobacterium NC_groundwater_1537_Pr4_S-0.65um_50_18]|nr:response regulator [Oscillatoriophycideae cyanobacterium NC_groundwater_1537_Pr4_S-0.65um_50_18]
MAINPDIRDQAYQFFSAEAPELLQIIETGLLSLSQGRSTAEVHNLMRAAHSLKGGAASVGLEAIATLSHRLENIFKALYSDTLEIDIHLESQLLRAYDCLRLPLMEQITTGELDSAAVLAIADPILTQIEQYCGEALLQTESYIPSSSDMGVSMLSSILEIDVVQGLEHLATVITHPQDYEVAGELRAQVEVFAGFAEMLNLPSLSTVADMVCSALDAHPDRALEITQLALADFERSRQISLEDRTQLIQPSATLLALAHGSSAHGADAQETLTQETLTQEILTQEPVAQEPAAYAYALDGAIDLPEPSLDALSAIPLLENVFGDAFNDSLVDSLGDDFGDDFDDDFDDDFEDTLDDDFDAVTEAESANVFETVISAPELAKSEQEAADLMNRSESIALSATENLHADSITVEPELEPFEGLETNVAIPSLTEAIDAEWVANGTVGSDKPDLDNVPLEILPEASGAIQLTRSAELYYPAGKVPLGRRMQPPAPLTVRVDSERLERMNNLTGELMIDREGLALQNGQLQSVLRELRNRFSRFQVTVSQLQERSDQILSASRNRDFDARTAAAPNGMAEKEEGSTFTAGATLTAPAADPGWVEFDTLEMDRYGSLYSQFQELLEDIVQLEESIDDVTLFTRQSSQILDRQQQTLSHLQNEFRWARMLPIGEVLNRFPRVLRDLSTTYHKPVNLTLTGTDILIDKAILEKLYDPLLHLIRNAFDHGIEPSSTRLQQGKPEQGQLEIRAYYKGNQTIIEVKDDGRGLNLDRIRSRAFELGWLSADQLIFTPPEQLFEFIFEPGFSTAAQVSELSGRGVGLDVVRSQLYAVKGSTTVTSTPGQGTTFTLHLPLTLTIAKLIICLIGTSAVAISADTVEEVLTPQANQVKQSGSQRFLYWREKIIPAYRLVDLLDYNCPLPETILGKSLTTLSSPENWEPPMLILRQEQQVFALEVDRLVNEQELIVKPFGKAITPPRYAYGCTILGDGSLVPVIDGSALLSLGESSSSAHVPTARKPAPIKTQIATILVVDDAITLRQTLALSLERAGFRVLQARDGWEAIDQLRHAAVKLVICDVEMPNMNGFEFLSHRRQDPQLSEIPVVMLTSRSNNKHRWLALKLGAVDYFSKPYLEQEFLAAIEKIIHPDI